MRGFQFEWPMCVCVCECEGEEVACVYELATSSSALRIVFHFNFVNLYSIALLILTD